jgi:photosystem II stability/assembly factor-like uncharacterized protein
MKATFLIIVITVLIFESTNAQWVLQHTGTSEDLYEIKMFSSSLGFACGEGGIILKTTNGGTNWISLTSGSGPDMFCFAFHHNGASFSDDTLFIAGRSGYLRRSTNGGNTWVLLPTGTTGSSINGIYSRDFGPVLGKLIIACSDNGEIIYSRNLGQTWQTAVSGTNLKLNDVNYNYFRNEIYVTGHLGVFLYSNDFLSVPNITFQSRPVPNQSENLLDISSETYPVMYISTSQGKVLSSSNGGVNWGISNTGVSSDLTCVSRAQSTFTFTAGENGVIRRTTNSSGWISQSIGQTLDYHAIDMVNINTGWIAGDSGVILKTTNGGLTSINQISSGTPSEFYLSQNYPNPFNPSTNFEFEIADFGFVTLKVYDVMGKEVRTLVSESLRAGVYKAEFDANGLPGGIYFYRLETAGFIDTKKMMLIK